MAESGKPNEFYELESKPNHQFLGKRTPNSDSTRPNYPKKYSFFVNEKFSQQCKHGILRISRKYFRSWPWNLKIPTFLAIFEKFEIQWPTYTSTNWNSWKIELVSPCGFDRVWWKIKTVYSVWLHQVKFSGYPNFKIFDFGRLPRLNRMKYFCEIFFKKS